MIEIRAQQSGHRWKGPEGAGELGACGAARGMRRILGAERRKGMDV